MRSKVILLVDDDPEDKLIIQDAMEVLESGDVMRFADDGQHAWRILEESNEKDSIPCLIVLDLNMPKLNGAQTLERIKNDSRFKNIPVIIFSTSINPLEKERCLILGAHAYVVKPVSFKESIETAKTFLAFCRSEIPVQES
ncbi:MAG: response regulator [Bacteroidota bacterium]|nr:response regulator [Bacteroidota bacterium]